MNALQEDGRPVAEPATGLPSAHRTINLPHRRAATIRKPLLAAAVAETQGDGAPASGAPGTDGHYAFLQTYRGVLTCRWTDIMDLYLLRFGVLERTPCAPRRHRREGGTTRRTGPCSIATPGGSGRGRSSLSPCRPWDRRHPPSAIGVRSATEPKAPVPQRPDPAGHCRRTTVPPIVALSPTTTGSHG